MHENRNNSKLPRRRPPTRAGSRPQVSYLVRCWLEPRDGEGKDALLRGYARDLRTGEEQYFGDPRRFAEAILRRLLTEGREEAPRREAPEMDTMAG